MRITRGAESPANPMDASHVTGAPTARDLGAYDAPEGSVLLVSFPAGDRSNWHRHPGGQFLYVTEGTGRVGTRDGEVVGIGVGDLVHAPPGEEHWHGAAADAGVTHLAVNLGATEWLEEVEP
jgi:quercetin dioxygenase-like cupin family protein